METTVAYWCNVIRVILGLHWGNGKNGNYCSILV